MNSLLLSLLLFFPTVLWGRTPNRSNGNLLNIGVTNSVRGWAILIIMIAHFTLIMGESIFGAFGGIGVAMFLFASGFGLNESYKRKGLLKYFTKKTLVYYSLIG